MNDLEKFMQEHEGRYLVKWKHYLEAYDNHFKRFRGGKAVVVEVGVLGGGSLQMWKSYFGPEAIIYGVDTDPKCAGMEEEQIHVMIGDQEELKFWDDFKLKVPMVDVFIDDGGHKWGQQIATMDCMLPHVSENGVYLCEDLHTSYLGRFKDRDVNTVDYIHDRYIKRFHNLLNSRNHMGIKSIHLYPGMVFFEKGDVGPIRTVTAGTLK